MTMTNATYTTYTKLKSGNWGIRSTSALTAGMKVSVTKKSGEIKNEIVESLVWSGNGVWIATIAVAARREHMGSGRGSAVRVRGYSSYCTDNSSCRCYDCAS